MLFFLIRYKCIINTRNKTKAIQSGVLEMTVKERILTIRLMERAKRDPDYAKQLGVEIVESEQKDEVPK